MSESLTAEQVRARNLEAMGAELGELFTVLSNELTWLFWRWSQFVKLYASKPTRIELLNASAPFFFRVVQDVLWYDTLLGISRLAGPAATGKKQNLSLRRLPELLESESLRRGVEDALEEVTRTSDFAVAWRNRFIAHRDLDVSLRRGAAALPQASRERVDAALDAMAALLNRIDHHFMNATTAYRSSPVINDAESLLYVLRDGLRREELRQERLDRGEYNPEDWDEGAPAV